MTHPQSVTFAILDRILLDYGFERRQKCFTEGDTKEEALMMIEDAQNAWIQTVLEKKHRFKNPKRCELKYNDFVFVVEVGTQ